MVNIVLCSACYAAGTSLLCRFGTPQTLILRLVFALLPANSFVSPSYAPFARKSFLSPTYAKTGGWGAFSCASFTSFASITSVPLATRHSLARRSFSGGGPLATNSNHSRTIGNCCPTSRTRSNIYHYSKYPCRRADNFVSGTHHCTSAIPGSSRNAFFQLCTVNCRL